MPRTRSSRKYIRKNRLSRKRISKRSNKRSRKLNKKLTRKQRGGSYEINTEKKDETKPLIEEKEDIELKEAYEELKKRKGWDKIKQSLCEKLLDKFNSLNIQDDIMINELNIRDVLIQLENNNLDELFNTLIQFLELNLNEETMKKLKKEYDIALDKKWSKKAPLNDFINHYIGEQQKTLTSLKETETLKKIIDTYKQELIDYLYSGLYYQDASMLKDFIFRNMQKLELKINIYIVIWKYFDETFKKKSQFRKILINRLQISKLILYALHFLCQDRDVYSNAVYVALDKPAYVPKNQSLYPETAVQTSDETLNGIGNNEPDDQTNTRSEGNKPDVVTIPRFDENINYFEV